MNDVKKIILKLKNPTVLLSTLTNIWVLLETVDMLNFCGTTKETYMKVVGVLIFVLIQLGILVNPEKENSTNEFDNMK